MINIIDGNSYIRRAFETDYGSRAPRKIAVDMLAMPPDRTTIWVFDHPTCRILRRKIYPEYKQGRQSAPDGFFEMVSYIREVLEHTRCLQICVPNFEADDVIATLTRRYHIKSPVRIDSIDQDLAQLLVFPNVTATFKTKIEPRWVRLYKSSVGDPSDNIPGIKGFGEKTWRDVDKSMLERLLTGHSERLPELPFRSANWLIDPDNLAMARKFYQIVGLYEVPLADIERHLKPGQQDEAKVNELLARYLH